MLAPAWEGNTLEVEAGESGVQRSLWLQRECEARRNIKANGGTGERKGNRTQGGSQFSTTALQAGFDWISIPSQTTNQGWTSPQQP